jgi:hypothetical protein
MKAIVPCFLCLVVLLHCCWTIHRAQTDFLFNKKFHVEITVYGPDGNVIPAIGRAPVQQQ